jgi:hypothetical protein
VSGASHLRSISIIQGSITRGTRKPPCLVLVSTVWGLDTIRGRRKVGLGERHLTSLTTMLVDAEEIAGGVVEVGRDLACGGVDGLDDLAAAGSDETDGAGGIVDHDGDDDAWLSRRRAIEDPHSAYFVDTIVKGDGAIAVDAQGPSKDGGVEGGGDGDVGGGDFEVADFSVGEGGWHCGSFSESLLQVSGWAR